MNSSEFNLIIIEYKEKYGKRIEKLRRIYKENIGNIDVAEFKLLCKKYREILKEMIVKLSKIFFKDYKKNIIVAISGSLARHTNTLFSDIDLNFLTDKTNFEDIIETEDKIAYILQMVIGFRGRDKVHTMTVYLPLISNIKYDYIYINNYPLKFKNSNLYFHCRPNAEKLMYENYNSTRNIYDVINYFNQNDTYESINEWTNCFEVIYENNNLEIYKKNRIVCKDNKNLIVHINNLIKEIEDDYDNIIVMNSEKNSFVKKVYKSNVLFNVYKMFAIYYRYEKQFIYFNIDEIESKSKCLSTKFFHTFYDYLNNLQILQVLFNYIKMDLSSHSEEIIEFESINQYYKSLTNKEDIIKELSKGKRNLYKICIEEIEKVRDDLL